MSDAPAPEPGELAHVLRHWGFWAMLAGALALLLFFVQVYLLTRTGESVPIGQQIGEIAGDIRRSAWRSFFGLSQPVPQPVTPSMTRQIIDGLTIAVPALGALAVVLSGISLATGERWRIAFYGVALGGAAILMQYLWWMALMILGVILLIKIIENIGDIFSF